jgi:IS30 family transposase
VAAADDENTNRLLRDHFPKSSDLKIHSPSDLARVSDELNRRARKTLGWQTPHDLFVSLREDVA